MSMFEPRSRSTSSDRSSVDMNQRIRHFHETDNITDHGIFNSNARRAVEIIMVYKEADLVARRAQRRFHPKMTHQVFGTSEQIYGYRRLKVRLYFSAHSAHCYVDLCYTGIVGESDGPFPDDILLQMEHWLPPAFTTDREFFLSTLQAEKTNNLFGTTVEAFSAKNATEDKTYEYIVTKCDKNTEGFLEFHKRFESLIVWHIDAANRVDTKDGQWTYFYLYEQRQLAGNQAASFFPVGYCSMYQLMRGTIRPRVRISQFYVLPPCQRCGLGIKLYSAVYRQVCQMRRVYDLTVEDPCEEFTIMRNMHDCMVLRELPSFQHPAIKGGLTKAMLREARKVYKIHVSQCYKVYFILRVSRIMRTRKRHAFDRLCTEVEEYLKNPPPSEPQGPLRTNKDGCVRASLEAPRRKSVTDDALAKQLDETLLELKEMGSRLNKKLGL